MIMKYIHSIYIYTYIYDKTWRGCYLYSNRIQSDSCNKGTANINIVISLRLETPIRLISSFKCVMLYIIVYNYNPFKHVS